MHHSKNGPSLIYRPGGGASTPFPATVAPLEEASTNAGKGTASAWATASPLPVDVDDDD